ncbi:hypothetical protein AURDEDRAFT_165819 [Auricularia subglabra TFB-10046 SS5]|nr:hypothetical protein AURDEDRAFT_165819 [Auricularia subglabra TFB-10046 SS5]
MAPFDISTPPSLLSLLPPPSADGFASDAYSVPRTVCKPSSRSSMHRYYSGSDGDLDHSRSTTSNPSALHRSDAPMPIAAFPGHSHRLIPLCNGLVEDALPIMREPSLDVKRENGRWERWLIDPLRSVSSSPGIRASRRRWEPRLQPRPYYLRRLVEGLHAGISHSTATIEREPQEHGHGNVDSVGLRAPLPARQIEKVRQSRIPSSRSRLTNSLADPFLAAVDCATHIERVLNVRPGATSVVAFFAVRADIVTDAGLTFSGRFRFSDVLSLHYRDRVLSCARSLPITNAASSSAAVASTAQFSAQFSVEHCPNEVPRTHPPATDGRVRRTREQDFPSEATLTRGPVAQVSETQNSGRVSLQSFSIRAVCARALPALVPAASGRAHYDALPPRLPTRRGEQELTAADAKDRSRPPPSTPPGSRRACVASPP